MAMWDLLNYVHENKIGEKTSLKELAERYRSKFNRIPVIVVNGLHVLDHCFRDLHSGMYGGQWSEYFQRISKLVEKMRAVDIEFVFYFDGSYRAPSKGEYKFRKQYQTRKIISTIHEVKQGNNKQQSHDRLPPGIPSYMRYILKYEFGCDVRSSMINLAQEIAKFAATSDNCIGILANNVDYIIFDNKPLLIAKDLDTETMVTNVVYRSEFIEVSGLKGFQLPLLSCMLGNYSIPVYELRNIHLPFYISRNRYRTKLVVEMIKRRGWTGIQEELSDIAAELQIAEEKLREGMSYYDLRTLTTKENEEYSLVRKKCADCSIPSPLYTLLHLKKHTEGSSMEDPDDNQLPPSSEVFRSIRQRLYYVLHSGNSVEVEESCVCKATASINSQNVSSIPVYIKEDIPPLEELLLGDVNKDIRWKLFAACMGITIPISHLQGVEPRLVSICSLLNFLIQNEDVGLEDWEVKSFIYQAIYPRSIDLSKLEIGKTTIRAVSLCGMLLRGVTTIIKVIPVCGYPIPFVEAMPWKYLEGEAFHYAYNLFKNSSNEDDVIKEICRNEKDTANQLIKLYRLTVTGTRLEE